MTGAQTSEIRYAPQPGSVVELAAGWPISLRIPDLTPSEVQVWHVDLARDSSFVCATRELLTDTEREKIDRFVFEVHRSQFTVTRGILRMLLGAHVGIPPEQIRFEYGERDKPRLAETTRGRDIRFNLTHSKNLALIAITQGRELGIDLEQIRDDVEIERIAKRFFDPEEFFQLESIPEPERRRAFFEVWTRKEAYVKARGDGLSFPFNEFRVSVGQCQAPALVGNRREPGDLGRWTMADLDLGPCFAASLVTEGKGWHLSGLQWSRRFPAANRTSDTKLQTLTAAGGM